MKIRNNILLIVIILIFSTTAVSYLLWNLYSGSQSAGDSLQVKKLIYGSKSMGPGVESLKLVKYELCPVTVQGPDDTVLVNYVNSDNRTLISEKFDTDGILIRVDYDSDRNGNMDVTEYYRAGHAVDRWEYDVDGDGNPEVIEDGRSGDLSVMKSAIHMGDQGIIPYSLMGFAV